MLTKGGNLTARKPKKTVSIQDKTRNPLVRHSDLKEFLAKKVDLLRKKMCFMVF